MTDEAGLFSPCLRDSQRPEASEAAARGELDCTYRCTESSADAGSRRHPVHAAVINAHAAKYRGLTEAVLAGAAPSAFAVAGRRCCLKVGDTAQNRQRASLSSTY